MEVAAGTLVVMAAHSTVVALVAAHTTVVALVAVHSAVPALVAVHTAVVAVHLDQLVRLMEFFGPLGLSFFI